MAPQNRPDSRNRIYVIKESRRFLTWVEEWLAAVEETFELELPSEDLETCRSIGDLKRLVASRVPLAPAGDCATQRAFYRLRRAICEALEIPRSAVRPATRFSELPFPRHLRLLGWWAMRRYAGIPRVSELIVPLLGFVFILGTSYLLGGLVVLGTIESSSGWLATLLATLLCSFLLVRVMGFLLEPFPDRRRTVGGAARLLAALDAPRSEPGKPAWTREEVSLEIDRLFIATTYVRDFTNRSLPI